MPKRKEFVITNKFIRLNNKKQLIDFVFKSPQENRKCSNSQQCIVRAQSVHSMDSIVCHRPTHRQRTEQQLNKLIFWLKRTQRLRTAKLID